MNKKVGWIVCLFCFSLICKKKGAKTFVSAIKKVNVLNLSVALSSQE